MDDHKRETLQALREKIGRIMVEKTPRKGFTPRQRELVWDEAEGCCSACENRLTGKWQIDHVIALALGGEHALSNWVAICVDCHKAKSARDVKAIAKVNRLHKTEAGEKRNTRSIPSRPFPEQHRPLQSRGFTPTRKARA